MATNNPSSDKNIPRGALQSNPAAGPILIDVSSENQDFSPPLRGISIGTAGALVVDCLEGTNITIPANALAIGIQHSMSITRVYNSGTTASELVGWW